MQNIFSEFSLPENKLNTNHESKRNSENRTYPFVGFVTRHNDVTGLGAAFCSNLHSVRHGRNMDTKRPCKYKSFQ